MKRFVLCLLIAGCDCSCPPEGCAPDDCEECEDAGLDTDTETETETETDEECAWNSGQHCACDVPGELCEDGETVCSQLDGDDGDHGVCIYYTTTDECPDSPWGEPVIIVNMAGGAMCFLACAENDDCPLDQSCITDDASGESICYP